MELFLPSLVFLLVGAAIAFFVLPTIAPVMLIGGSAAVLAGVLYLHYSRFGRMEYEQATWYNSLRAYSSWIILAVVLLMAYSFYTMSPSPAPAPFSIPTMSGGGIAGVLNNAVSRISELARRGRISSN